MRAEGMGRRMEGRIYGSRRMLFLAATDPPIDLDRDNRTVQRARAPTSRRDDRVPRRINRTKNGKSGYDEERRGRVARMGSIPSSCAQLRGRGRSLSATYNKLRRRSFPRSCLRSHESPSPSCFATFPKELRRR